MKSLGKTQWGRFDPRRGPGGDARTNQKSQGTCKEVWRKVAGFDPDSGGKKQSGGGQTGNLTLNT